jgi:hypothetical protein
MSEYKRRGIPPCVRVGTGTRITRPQGCCKRRNADAACPRSVTDCFEFSVPTGCGQQTSILDFRSVTGCESCATAAKCRKVPIRKLQVHAAATAGC